MGQDLLVFAVKPSGPFMVSPELADGSNYERTALDMVRANELATIKRPWEWESVPVGSTHRTQREWVGRCSQARLRGYYAGIGASGDGSSVSKTFNGRQILEALSNRTRAKNCPAEL